jgi:hypothetical protein
MRRFIWIDGRFSWWLIGAIVFFSVSLIAFDLVWRMVKTQFGTLLIYGVMVDVAMAIILLFGARLFRRSNLHRAITDSQDIST